MSDEQILVIRSMRSRVGRPHRRYGWLEARLKVVVDWFSRAAVTRKIIAGELGKLPS